MIWLITLSACANKPVPPEPPTPAPAAAVAPIQAHMAEHLSRATAIRDAVVWGDFDGARAGFQWVVDHEDAAGLPALGNNWLGALRDSATAGVAAESLSAQAVALGELANTCGGCHQTLSTRPLLPELPSPAPGAGLHPHMARHHWANDRMWAALVEPSAAAWERSLRVLSDDGLSAAQRAEWGLHDGAEVRDQAVHRLAHAALADDNPDTRADLYGQIVAECAACHRAARGEPPR